MTSTARWGGWIDDSSILTSVTQTRFTTSSRRSKFLRPNPSAWIPHLGPSKWDIMAQQSKRALPEIKAFKQKALKDLPTIAPSCAQALQQKVALLMQIANLLSTSAVWGEGLKPFPAPSPPQQGGEVPHPRRSRPVIVRPWSQKMHLIYLYILYPTEHKEKSEWETQREVYRFHYKNSSCESFKIFCCIFSVFLNQQLLQDAWFEERSPSRPEAFKVDEQHATRFVNQW